MADLQIPNPSITTKVFEYDEAGRVSAISGHPLAGGGGGTVVKSDLMWKPTVESDGYVRWTLASSATTPEAAYISGAQGPAGPQGEQGEPGPQGVSGAKGDPGEKGEKGDNATPITATTAAIAGGTQVTISYISGGDPLAQFNVLSGAQGASGQNGKDGKDGQDGKDGANGISPTVTTATIEGTPGGVAVTISGADGEHVFNIYNGQDGTGASYTFDGTTLSGNGTTTNIGVNTDAAVNFTNASAKSATYAEQYFDPKSELNVLIADRFDTVFEKFDGYVPYSARTLAIGYKNSAAFCDFAQGETNYANKYSISQGGSNSAKDYSIAQGYSNTANNHSFAQGECNTATETAFAQGKNNYSYSNAMSQGFGNSADYDSFAQGKTNYAYNYSIAQGEDNYAHNYALAQGTNTSAIANSFAQGNDNYADDNALSQGQTNYAKDDAFAQGASNSAYYASFTQGTNNSASYQGLAQGINNYAHGNGFAQGYGNIAQNHSFAQGHTCTAIGESFAQGFDCYAENHSQAVGLNTYASYYMMAIGAYNNIANKNNEYAAFVVGNGNAIDGVVTRSDAFVIYQDGRVSAAGKISANGVELGAGGGTVYDIIGNNGISAKKDTTNGRYEVGLSASVTSQLSKIDTKTTVISGAGNVFTVSDDNTSNPAKNFTFSAVNYKSGQNAGYLPQQLFVVTSDSEIVSLVNSDAADGKGCLFFRVQ